MNRALPRIQKTGIYKPPLENRSNFNGLLLDFNERRADPAFLKTVMNKLARGGKLHMYPEYFDLEKAIADYAGVSADKIMITSGSDQAIGLVFRTFADESDEVVIPSPSFAMFYQLAGISGCKVLKPEYKPEDLSFRTDEVIRCIKPETKVVVVCNPNNPTGSLVSVGDIEKIAKKASRSIVLVDEAYFEFSNTSATGLLDDYPNILITRTFSKAFGLAGLRVGYVIGAKENLDELRKLRGPYAVNAVAVAVAKQAMSDKSEMLAYTKEVMTEAKPFLEKFLVRNKIKFYKSAANFILIKPKNAEQTYELLKQNGVLVRPRAEDGIKGTLRVTVTTLEQMKRFCEIYERAIIRNERITS